MIIVGQGRRISDVSIIMDRVIMGCALVGIRKIPMSNNKIVDNRSIRCGYLFILRALLLFMLGLLVTMFIVSCKKESKQIGNSDRSVIFYLKNATPKKLYGHDLLLPDLIADASLLEYYQKKLFIVESSSTNNNVKVIHLDKNNKIINFIKRGNGAAELQYVDNLQFTNNEFMVYDPYSLGVYVCPLDKDSINWQEDQIIHYDVSDIFPHKIVKIKDYLYILYYGWDVFSRFARFDLKEKKIKYMGAFPFHPKQEELDKKILNSLHSGLIYARPDEERFVIASEYEDLIQIYDSNGTLMVNVKGPDEFFPEMAIKYNKEGGYQTLNKRGKTRNGYVAVSTSQDEIFALYSGQLVVDQEGNRDFYNKKIFRFDWDGQLLQAYRLDIGVYNIAVDTDAQIIYAITDEDSDTRIVQFRYE